MRTITTRLCAGDAVFRRTFCKGVVLRASGVMVEFEFEESASEKTLAVGRAPLEKIV